MSADTNTVVNTITTVTLVELICVQQATVTVIFAGDIVNKITKKQSQSIIIKKNQVSNNTSQKPMDSDMCNGRGGSSDNE